MSSVRFVFVADPTSSVSVVPPAPLLADAATVTCARLWRYATSALTGDQSKLIVDVLTAEGTRIPKDSESPLVVDAKYTRKRGGGDDDGTVVPPCVVTVRAKYPQRLPSGRDRMQPSGDAAVTFGRCIGCHSEGTALLDCGHITCATCAKSAAKTGKETVTCPLCFFETQPLSDFDERSSGSDGRVPLDRGAHDVLRACARTTKCAVCNVKDAVGRCCVELVNLCHACFEEHLPSGPLRVTHKILDAEAATAVLCDNPGHRSLPVKFLCVGHGVLGCHMCVRETTDHASCNVVTSDDQLAEVAASLRDKREVEVNALINVANGQSRAAWEQYDKLRRDHVELSRNIRDRAFALREEIATKEREALSKLDDAVARTASLLQQRLSALDEVRSRAAKIGAVLDGHRALPPQLLLHAESKGLLSFDMKEDLAPVQIGEIVVDLEQMLPPLFTVDVKLNDGRDHNLSGVKRTQAALSDVATKWAASKTAGAPSRRTVQVADPKAPQAPAAATKTAKSVAAEPALSTGIFTSASATRTVALSPVTVADESGAERALETQTIANAAAGPKGYGLFVDSRNAVVVVVKLDSNATTAILGAAPPAAAAGDAPSAAVSVRVLGPRFKQLTSAVFHPTMRSVVVCDAGEARLILFPEASLSTAPAGAEPGVSQTPDGAFKRPIAAVPHGKSGVLVADVGAGLYHVVTLQPSFKIERSVPISSPQRPLPPAAHLALNDSFVTMLQDNALHFGNAKSWRYIDALDSRHVFAVAPHPTEPICVAAVRSTRSNTEVILSAYDLQGGVTVAAPPAETPRKLANGRQVQPAATEMKPAAAATPSSFVVKRYCEASVSLSTVLPDLASNPSVSLTVDGVFFDGPKRIALVVRALQPTEYETVAEGGSAETVWTFKSTPSVVVMLNLPQALAKGSS